MTTDLVGLDLELHTGTLADKIRRAGQAKALVTFAKEIEDHARADLEAEARKETDRTGGGGFTKKVDGVQAVVTDPQPKPHVTDVGEFAGWWADQGLEHQTIERAEFYNDAIATDDRVLDALRRLIDDSEQLPDKEVADLGVFLAEAISIRTETLLPEKPLDRLTESGRCIATDTGLIDTTTGEQVPGVECRRQAAQLRVTPDKTAKARDRAIVASFFGLPAQLPSGGA